MATLAGTRELFAGLLDDAAMFPPGNASAARAIAEHLEHRDSWYGDLVGPLLVHTDRWSELLHAHRMAGAPAIDVVVIGSTTRPEPVPVELAIRGYEALADDGRFEPPSDGTPVAVEIAVPAATGDRDAARGHEDVLDEIANRRAAGAPVIAKLRTGGETAAAFPSEAALAAVISSAASRRIPLKCTAGLHHAVRQTESGTDLERHGFLNLLAATRLAWGGREGDSSDVAALLAVRAADELAALVRAWAPDDVADARNAFVSFGCCGVQDPVRDLVRLGLVEDAVRVEEPR